jgi:D-glycero-D-manno-heptose 1,7-bisphosphate phosphatase
MPIRHVILDRDGVLNRERPDGSWVAKVEDWIWEDGAMEGLRLLTAAGLRLTVATNQSGVGRGVFGIEAVEAVNGRMLREALAEGVSIAAVYVCPHAPEDGCDCRKPLPGLIVQAVEEAGIPAHETVVVGDAPRDLDAARAAGVRAVLVRTGKGAATETELVEDDIAVYDDLASWSRAIVAEG